MEKDRCKFFMVKFKTDLLNHSQYGKLIHIYWRYNRRSHTYALSQRDGRATNADDK